MRPQTQSRAMGVCGALTSVVVRAELAVLASWLANASENVSVIGHQFQLQSRCEVNPPRCL
jgi:hypothetical protein